MPSGPRVGRGQRGQRIILTSNNHNSAEANAHMGSAEANAGNGLILTSNNHNSAEANAVKGHAEANAGNGSP